MLRVSPQKLNLVAQLIAAEGVGGARRPAFSRKRIAVDVKKCWNRRSRTPRTTMTSRSTISSLPSHVGNGIVMKRFAPRGRAVRAVSINRSRT